MPGDRDWPGSVFAGRADELAVLDAAADAAMTGRPGVVWVEGEAGVGKSSLVRQWVAAARPDIAVLRVTGDEYAADMPWAALASLVDVGDADVVGPSAVGLRLLERLGSETTGWLGVLVIEDLHWIDQRTRRALASAAARIDGEPFVLIVTSRPEALRVDDGWARIVHDPQRCRRIVLNGLPVSGVSALAAGRGVDLSEAAASRLRDHTGGNPLYVSMLLSELTPATLAAAAGPLPAPRTLAATVAATLRQLPAPALGLVGALAVVNRPMPLPAVASIASVDDAADALGHLTSAGLAHWERSEVSVASVTIAHPMIRSAVYDDLSPVRRRDLHRRVAHFVDDETALAHRVAAADRVDETLAAELEAVAMRGPMSARGARLLRWAADLTADSAAFERRVLWWARHSIRADDAGTVRAQQPLIESFQPSGLRDFVLGRLALQYGDAARAEALLTAAANNTDDAEVAGAASTVLAVLYVARAQTDRAIAAATRGVERAGTDRLAFDAAFQLLVMGTAQRDGARPALELLPSDRSLGQDADLEPAFTRGVLRTFAGEMTAGIADLQRAISMGRHLPDPEQARRSRVHLAKALIVVGRWDEALVHARTALELATGQAWHRALALDPLVAVLTARGEWDVARGLLTELEELAGRAGTGEPRNALRSASVAWYQARNDPTGVIAAAPVRRSDLAAKMSWLDVWPPLIRATLQLDEPRAAADLLEQYEAVAAAQQVDVAFQLHDLRGRLAIRAGDPQQARTEFAAAHVAVTADQPVLDVAMSHVAHGQLLRNQNERHAAVGQLRIARTILAALGAVPYLDRVDRELADAGLTRPQRTEGRSPLDLTAREHDVVTLATRGLMNKEIAAQLFVSTKAVEYHLRNIYGKLGITSRRELADATRAR